MAPPDRFDEMWKDIPDPLAPSSAAAARSVEPPRAASPTRAAMKTRRAVALAAMVAWSALVLLRWGFRPQIASSFVAGPAILFAVLLVSAGLIAISPGRRGLGGPVSRARIAAVGRADRIHVDRPVLAPPGFAGLLRRHRTGRRGRSVSLDWPPGRGPDPPRGSVGVAAHIPERCELARGGARRGGRARRIARADDALRQSVRWPRGARPRVADRHRGGGSCSCVEGDAGLEPLKTWQMLQRS